MTARKDQPTVAGTVELSEVDLESAQGGGAASSFTGLVNRLPAKTANKEAPARLEAEIYVEE